MYASHAAKGISLNKDLIMGKVYFGEEDARTDNWIISESWQE